MNSLLLYYTAFEGPSKVKYYLISLFMGLVGPLLAPLDVGESSGGGS